MILHIFKKDLSRLWPLVAGLAVTEFAYAILLPLAGLFPDDHPVLTAAVALLVVVTFLLPLFLAVMAVQLDPIPDDRQDWLVRPIRRWDLLFAKLLFVILLIHGPMLAAFILQGLATGFPLDQTLSAALPQTLYWFLTFSVPAMAVGALTRSIGQMLGLALAVLVALLVIVGSTVWAINIWHAGYLFSGLGSSFTATVLRIVLLLAGTTAILRLQYFRRATNPGRVLLGATAILALMAQVLLPQSAAFALEGWLSSAPGQAITPSFAPEAGKFRAGKSAPAAIGREGDVTIDLPMHFAGLAADQALQGQNIVVRLTSLGEEPQQFGGTLLFRPDQPGAPYYVQLQMKKDVLRAYGDRPVRAEMELLLSLRGPGHSYELPVNGGDLLIPGLGRCATRLKGGVQINCLQAGDRRLQAGIALSDHAGAAHNPSDERYWFASDAPFGNGADMIQHFGTTLSFLNLNAASRPVVVITVSQPLARLVRHVTIPAVRLGDWKTDVAVAAQ